MAIKQVLRMGDPLLWQKAAPVTMFNTPELHALIEDMQDTMAAMDGAGIAAPQIGVSLRVVIFGVADNPRYPDAEQVPYTILINPTLKHVGTEMEDGWEGCLSVPGLRGIVPRYERL
ncbi:MAG: peptide deformylase, partial [Methylophilus sp.]